MMPKAPTVFSRPHSYHQNLQQQALDARAGCTLLHAKTWPTTKQSSRPLTALALNVDSPYLLAKPLLRPARRLPAMRVIENMPAASSFFYSNTNFFEYSTDNKLSLDTARGRFVTVQKLNASDRPHSSPVAAAQRAKLPTPDASLRLPTTKEPRRNTYKRLRRDSTSSVDSQSDPQRNTVAFPSSAAPEQANAPLRKRARAGPLYDISNQQTTDDPQWSMSFYDAFYQPLNVGIPRKKKRSRRQRLYGRKVCPQAWS